VPPAPDDAVSAETLQSISTPDRVETRIGALEFFDGLPTPGTVEAAYDSPLEPWFDRRWRPGEIELVS
jgi:hypothetical protein